MEVTIITSGGFKLGKDCFSTSEGRISLVCMLQEEYLVTSLFFLFLLSWNQTCPGWNSCLNMTFPWRLWASHWLSNPLTSQGFCEGKIKGDLFHRACAITEKAYLPGPVKLHCFKKKTNPNPKLVDRIESGEIGRNNWSKSYKSKKSPKLWTNSGVLLPPELTMQSLHIALSHAGLLWLNQSLFFYIQTLIASRHWENTSVKPLQADTVRTAKYHHHTNDS